MIRHVRMGRVVQTLVRGFPSLLLTATIQPITRTVLKVRLTIVPDFEWSDKLHGMTSDPWWIWVEDAENNQMYHSEYFLLQRKQVIIIFWLVPSKQSNTVCSFTNKTFVNFRCWPGSRRIWCSLSQYLSPSPLSTTCVLSQIAG